MLYNKVILCAINDYISNFTYVIIRIDTARYFPFVIHITQID